MGADTPPKTQTAHSQTLGAQEPVRLVVVEGQDLGKEFILSRGTASIGTQSTCDLVLTDSTVSRQHISVSYLGRWVRVRDLGSKNGTRFLGARIEAAEVPVGGSVLLGNTRLSFFPAQLSDVPLSTHSQLSGMLGSSVGMRRLFTQLERLAPTETPVVLQGETGCGKECAARAIHALSPRSGGPFRVVDCAGLRSELFTSELFGHVKGAFTGAIQDRKGAILEAHQGTLLLDQLDELPLDLQPTLTRVLDTGEFTPVGGNQSCTSSFRLLATTQNDLQRAVDENRFDRGLFHRLGAVTLPIPPLRDRPDDIVPLAELFASKAPGEPARLDSSSLAYLVGYQWPGNVRELRATVERMLVLGNPLPPSAAKEGQIGFHRAREVAVRAFEKEYVRSLMERHGGSATAASREAGMTRSYLYHLLGLHGLKPKKRED